VSSAGGAANKSARYVQSVDVVNGTIQIVYGRDANQKINNLRLDIQPFVNANGDVVWVCGNANDPAGAGINADPGGGASPNGASTVLDKHMPASCRTGFGGL